MLQHDMRFLKLVECGDAPLYTGKLEPFVMVLCVAGFVKLKFTMTR